MKTAYIVLLTASIIATGCRTPQEAAQRHLRKAIALDPTVVQRRTVDTIINGIATGNVDVKVPGTEGSFDLDVEKLKNDVEEAPKNTETVIYSYADSALTLSVKKQANGKVLANYQINPKIVNVPVKIPYRVEVRVPGERINMPIDRPFYIYKWFWILLAICLLTTYLWLSSNGAVQQFITKMRKK